MTVDAFPQNVAASHINVRLEDLETLYKAFQHHLIQQTVARCSECVKDYFAWIIDFSERIFGSSHDSNLPFFEGIAKQIGVTDSDLCPNAMYLTLDHLRYRRNCLVHRDNDSNASFDKLRRQKGHQLNQFWNKRLAPRHPARIDFQDPDPSNVSSECLVDILRLARLSVEEFDCRYCRYIPPAKLNDYLEKEFDRRVDCSGINNRRRIKKLKQFARSHFGYEIITPGVSLNGKAAPLESTLD